MSSSAREATISIAMYPEELRQLPIALVESIKDSLLVLRLVIAPRHPNRFSLLICPITKIANEHQQFVDDLFLFFGGEAFKRSPRHWADKRFWRSRHET